MKNFLHHVLSVHLNPGVELIALSEPVCDLVSYLGAYCLSDTLNCSEYWSVISVYSIFSCA